MIVSFLAPWIRAVFVTRFGPAEHRKSDTVHLLSLGLKRTVRFLLLCYWNPLTVLGMIPMSLNWEARGQTAEVLMVAAILDATK